jgi:hypothetical protein
VQSGPQADTYTLSFPPNGQADKLPIEPGAGVFGCLLTIGAKVPAGTSQGYEQFINIYYPPF